VVIKSPPTLSIKEFFDFLVFMWFCIVVQDEWIMKPVVSYLWKYFNFLLQKINIYLKIDIRIFRQNSIIKYPILMKSNNHHHLPIIYHCSYFGGPAVSSMAASIILVL
jgi:hypothetical protein